MITQIEIDGFKTFKDFKVELAPFQVIIGPNGSGKSNLFDALQLLSRLSDHDVLESFLELRGEVSDFFTKYTTETSSERLLFAVEVLLDRKMRRDRLLYPSNKFDYTRLRYELEIILCNQQDDPDQLKVRYEALKVISPEQDSWCKKNNIRVDDKPIPGDLVNNVLFSQASAEKSGEKEVVTMKIYLGSDDQEDLSNLNGKIDSGYFVQTSVTPIYNTVLNENPRVIMRSTKFRNNDLVVDHLVAMRDEFRTLRFLHLNPQVLRQPSSVKAPRTFAVDGRNLPTTLARMQAEDKYVMGDLSRDMAQLVPGIRKIRVERDRLTDRYSIQAKMVDKRVFSAKVLSDGMLRLLALATLKNDAQFHGVLCMEEPENGVDPLHLKNLLRLLRAMATDFKDAAWADKPLRQVIITTHSPLLVGLPEVTSSLLFALKVDHIELGKDVLQVTRMIPAVASEVVGEDRDIAMEMYTIDQVKKYLDSSDLSEALEQLNRARASLL